VIEKMEKNSQRPQKKQQNLRLVKGKDTPKETEGFVYVFHISILYIAPEIWRSFQVPGSFNLGELHDVIQVVMGWENYHLHSFEINKKIYGPEPEEILDFDMEQFDEYEYTLDSLNLKAKKKFLYTYDFGDDWEHQITVTKVLPVSGLDPKDRSRPLCLAGERACPPEDCGSIPGYDNVIEALKAPKKKENKELLEWVGSYDPEAFDINAVNKILKKG
jgi:hypothetical protein